MTDQLQAATIGAPARPQADAAPLRPVALTTLIFGAFLPMLSFFVINVALPAIGSDLRSGEKVVGFVGTSARHHELGPIALALVKRNVPLEQQLEVDGLPAAQEIVVDPEAGLHVRR